MTKKLTAWVLTGALVLGALGIWAAWTVRMRQYDNRLSLQLEAERQRNFHELVGHMQALQGLLGKGTVAGSVRQNMYYMSEVYRRSSLATANFMALPLPGPLTASVGKFLNQTGDFAYSIARNEAAGRVMDAKQRAELMRLQEASAGLANELQQVGQQANRKGFRWVSAGPTLADLFRGRREPNGEGPVARNQAPKNLLPGGFESIGPQMDKMPMMIYDGPFSDHLKDLKPAMTGAIISVEESHRRAMAFIPHSERYTIVETVKRNGAPKVFAVRLAPKDAAAGGRPTSYSVTVDVAEAGGFIASFVNSRPPGPAAISMEQAQELGRTFLEQRGFPNMVPTFGEATDGLAVIQYALKERGAMIYPDQIKVRVALDTGEIVGVDTRHYLMAHRDRGPLETPAVTQADAAKVVNPELKVERIQLALIPTEVGDNEVLTYEFTGRMGNNTYLVYVNAKSGEEERILQVLTTQKGKLAL